MIKFIKWLLGLCDHSWEIHEEGNIISSDVVIGRYYHLRCENCGNMKEKRLKGDV